MVSNHDNLHRVFHEGFSARDIAQTLPSFDGTARCQDVHAIMCSKAYEVVGIRTDGIAAGYAELADLAGGCCGEIARRFDETQLVTENMPLASLVIRLKDPPTFDVHGEWL